MKNIVKICSLILLTFLMVKCTTESEKTNDIQKSDLEKVAVLNSVDNKVKVENLFIKKWEKEVAITKPNFSLDTKFELEQIDNSEHLILIGTSKDGSIKTAIEVIKKGNEYYYYRLGGTITCEGCRRGCNPEKDGDGDWSCTDCKFSNGSCKKTVVAPTDNSFTE